MNNENKMIIYQVFTRLFGNNNNHCVYNGDITAKGNLLRSFFYYGFGSVSSHGRKSSRNRNRLCATEIIKGKSKGTSCKRNFDRIAQREIFAVGFYSMVCDGHGISINGTPVPASLCFAC